MQRRIRRNLSAKKSREVFKRKQKGKNLKGWRPHGGRKGKEATQGAGRKNRASDKNRAGAQSKIHKRQKRRKTGSNHDSNVYETKSGKIPFQERRKANEKTREC